jgi:hypothetical protein
MTTPALDALRALLPLLARDEDRAVTGVFDGDTLDAIEAALALIDDDGADDADLRHESEKAQLRAEIGRRQSDIAALEAVVAEARRNDAIATSWIAEVETALKASEARCATLADALRSTAQTLAWMQHGKCRGFSDDLLTTNEALEKARAALEKLK